MCYNPPVMHVVLLRLALALYSVGFAHSVLTALQKRQTLFRLALASVSVGFGLHVLSIVLQSAKSLTPQQFRRWHPAGALGKRR